MTTVESKYQIFPAHSLRIAAVTVFEDRAEVVRTIKASLKSGINEICVQNISKFAVENSVKVEQRGTATVKEVNFHKSVALPNEESQSPRLKFLNDERKMLINEQLKQVDREELLKKEVEAVDEMVCEASNNIVKSSEDQESAVLAVEDEDLKAYSDFLEFYMQLSLEKRENLRLCEKVRKEVDEKLEKVNAEIQELQSSCMFARNVTIVLEATKDGDIELDLSYQVWHAKWFPSYDIRLIEDETNRSLMKVTYYGKIEQRTGEDWLDAPIILSTAKPILGGNVPELGTLCAKFYVPHFYTKLCCAVRKGSKRVPSLAATKTCQQSGEGEEMKVEVDNDSLEPAMATSTDAVLSTTFETSRPTTILSGSNQHKVVITALDLEPVITYQTVPCRDKNVYIVASATNTSSFPFLTGETSIYVNNSFVSKSNMKNVSPDERFQCVLGLEPAISIEYKPAERFSEQVGVIAKSTSKITHEQKIVVRSTKQTKVLLMVKELVPKSTDEKIKIRLFSPELSQRQGAEGGVNTALSNIGAKLDKDHNLEWTFNVEPNSAVEKIVKWTVEYPILESVDLVETPLQNVL